MELISSIFFIPIISCLFSNIKSTLSSDLIESNININYENTTNLETSFANNSFQGINVRKSSSVYNEYSTEEVERNSEYFKYQEEEEEEKEDRKIEVGNLIAKNDKSDDGIPVVTYSTLPKNIKERSSSDYQKNEINRNQKICKNGKSCLIVNSFTNLTILPGSYIEYLTIDSSVCLLKNLTVTSAMEIDSSIVKKCKNLSFITLQGKNLLFYHT